MERLITLKSRCFFICLFVLLNFFTLSVLAANGDGAGGGSGQPLTLLSVKLEDGTSLYDANNVTTDPKFTLQFDKNVVNLIYWKKNVSCFHLVDLKGNAVEIDVTKIDDTVNFADRQTIWVEPKNPLSAGTTYKLQISPELIAKNGVSTLGGSTENKGVTISFTTSGGASSGNAEISPSAQDSGNVTSPDATISSPSTADSSNNENTKPLTSSFQNIAAAVAVITIIIWLIIEIVKKRGKKKR